MSANLGVTALFRGAIQKLGILRVSLFDTDGVPTVITGGGTSDADGSTFTAGVTDGSPAMGAYNATPRTVADGKLGIIAIDANGHVIVSGATGGTQYTRGTATGSSDVVNLSGVYRSDTATAQNTAGTISLLIVDGSGRLWVNVGTSVLPTGAATEVTLSAAAASVSTLAGIVTSNRAATNPIVGQSGIAGGTGVDGATVPRFTLATNVGLPAGSNVIGHVILDSGVVTTITNQVDTNLKQIGGTNTVSGGVAGTQAIGGSVATNVAIGTNPVNLGAQAVSSENTAVTTARMVQLVADLVGKLIVLPYANPENFIMGTTAAITDTTSTSVIASAGGSLRNYITSILVTNSHATVGTFVKILDGATIIYEGYAAAAGGGFSVSLPVPLRGTAATAINAQAVTTGANFIVSCAGYKGL